MVATPKGWTVYFGGNGGTRPRFGDLVAKDLSNGDALDCALRLAGYYRDHAKPHERTARFMERVGVDTLRSELLSLLPYIPLEKVD
jgi:NAD(P)H-nitrite reductase large subunit